VRLLALLFVLLLPAPAAAEQPVLIPSRPGVSMRLPVLPSLPVVQRITRSSGMIFSGVVLQVRRAELGKTRSPSTQITFRVETAIRGVRRGQVIRISEWSGLWNAGERYVEGERVLLFLYPKSKLGLTSPVGGKEGRYSVDSAGQVLIDGPQHLPRPVPLKTIEADIRRTAQE
jgi:hypothetical protein